MSAGVQRSGVGVRAEVPSMGTAAMARRGGLEVDRVLGRRRWVGGGRPGREGADPIASASIGGGVWFYGVRRIGVGWGGRGVSLLAGALVGFLTRCRDGII